MKTKQWALCAALAGLALSTQAGACTLADLRAQAGSSASAFAQFAGSIRAATQGRTAGSAQTAGNGPHAPRSAIVGFWRFAWTAPDGVSGIDWGYQQWHRDGTEITNSGGRPAKNGDFCLGVWKQLGDGSYSLNHWAMAWGNPPDFSDDTTLSGLVNIREVVDVDASGDTMTGDVSLDLYAPDGETLLGHIVDGTVTGTRVTP